MNSRAKGARGERQWRDELRAHGYEARRGQQFSGSPDSPDVVCEALPWAHFEVKFTERLNVYDAMEQARKDAGKFEIRNPRSEGGQNGSGGDAEKAELRKVPIVTHRRSNWPWLVTMESETFFRVLRGDFTAENAKGAEGGKIMDGKTMVNESKNFGNGGFGAEAGPANATATCDGEQKQKGNSEL